MLIFRQINVSLTTVIIQRRVFFLIQQIRQSSGNSRMRPLAYPSKKFIGLKSKMYSYFKDHGKNVKTCKGVKKDVIKKNITHENYIDT